jgi:hypothetical protein
MDKRGQVKHINSIIIHVKIIDPNQDLLLTRYVSVARQKLLHGKW